MPGRLAATASQLYAKNLFAFVETLIDKKEKTLAVNFEDELVKATLLTHGGAIVHPAFAAAAPASGAAEEPKTKAKSAKSKSDDKAA